MNKLLLIFVASLPCLANCQSTGLYNKGGELYVQKGALLEVQGTFTNDTGTVQNDGIIELQGNFQNINGASFGVFTDNTSPERAVKFVGSGTQAISGNISSTGTASFYNLVVDKASSTDEVQMQTNVTVEGSLAFGTTSFTSTYNTSNLYTNNNQKGLLATYQDSSEYNLTMTNGNTDVISGYPALAMNGAPTSGYILTSGLRGTSNGGLQRQIASATSYDFPIGTSAHGFNAVRMNFTNIPAGGGMVKGKFNDGTDNPNGSVGTLATECIGCTSQNPTPANSGYNRFFTENPCNNNAPQWLMLDDAILNHGYWSFASASNSESYSYSIETFANNFAMEGTNTDTWRTLQYSSAYGFNPSAGSVTWNNNIDSVLSMNDLLEYSLNTGTCYTGQGVPGGVYRGFGQFALKKSNSGGALPVKMIYVNATPVAQSIQVAWATALEINNNGFEVERSIDGVNFTQIGFVNGHDNSTVQQNYTYTDNTVDGNIVYYYRLNDLDNNGNGTLSQIASAELTGAASTNGATFAISEPMPNPASVSSRFVVSSTISQSASVKLYNMSGQLVSSQPFNLSAGDNSINLNVQPLASGNYSAVIEAEGNSYSKLIVVSR